MGAQYFEDVVEGKTAVEAFNEARDAAIDALLTYPGDIAGKNEFVMVDVPLGEDPKRFAEKLIDSGPDCNPDEDSIHSKWGPAGCIKLEDGKWLFFGLAAS